MVWRVQCLLCERLVIQSPDKKLGMAACLCHRGAAEAEVIPGAC